MDCKFDQIKHNNRFISNNSFITGETEYSLRFKRRGQSFRIWRFRNLRAIQSPETLVISDFEITFKQMRFASTLTNAQLYMNNVDFAGRLNQQGAPITQLGTNAVTQSTNTFANGLASII